MKKINKIFLDLYDRYREIINYLIFGVLTTLVNFVFYFVLVNIFGMYYIYANIIAWFFSVLFAYITNRIFVFERVNFSIKSIVKEGTLFFSARLFSGFVETAILYIMVDFMKIGEGISKIVVAVVVVVLNYFFSKFIIFKKK